MLVWAHHPPDLTRDGEVLVLDPQVLSADVEGVEAYVEVQEWRWVARVSPFRGLGTID